MRNSPNVEKYMTIAPHTVGADQTLAKVEKIMSEFRIRHLPVLDGGKLVGIVSEGDVRLVESFKDVNPEEVPVSEVCQEDIYMVSPKAPLREVCSEMARHKYGAVLVVENHKLVGIFTWIDALHALSEMLDESRIPERV